MAGVKEYWTTVHKNTYSLQNNTNFYESCIFQQQWNETCKWSRIFWSYCSFRMQHVEFVTRLLLDGLLDHDFDTAARCIMGLCGHIRQVSELVWRVGCEVLRSFKRNHARIVQFFKYVFMLCYPYQEEILLDFGLYLIQEKQEITEAYELISGKCGNKPFDKNKLLKAYLGLFEYTNWKTKLTPQKLSSVDLEFDTNVGTEKSKQIDYHGNKAMGFFKDLVETDGLWDVFITRQVELLVYYGEVDEARRVLERYIEKNPDNPNAHRYLYYFLKNQDAPASEMQAVLAKLFVVDPTSELVKEYKEILKESEEPTHLGNSKSACNLLSVVFNKLDHYSCHKSLNDWKSLSDLLNICYLENPGNKDIDKTIEDCWEERVDWWPQYHFQECQLSRTESINDYDWNVILEKAKVARCLLGKDNAFVKAVQELGEARLKKHAAKKDGIKQQDLLKKNSSCAESEPFKKSSKKLKRRIGCDEVHSKKKIKSGS